MRRETLFWHGNALSFDGEDVHVQLLFDLIGRRAPFPLFASIWHLQEALGIPEEQRTPTVDLAEITITYADTHHDQAAILAAQLRTAGLQVVGDTFADVQRAISGQPFLGYETPSSVIGRLLGCPLGTPAEEISGHVFTRAELAALLGVSATATKAELATAVQTAVAAAAAPVSGTGATTP